MQAAGEDKELGVRFRVCVFSVGRMRVYVWFLLSMFLCMIHRTQRSLLASVYAGGDQKVAGAAHDEAAGEAGCGGTGRRCFSHVYCLPSNHLLIDSPHHAPFHTTVTISIDNPPPLTA